MAKLRLVIKMLQFHHKCYPLNWILLTEMITLRGRFLLGAQSHMYYKYISSTELKRKAIKTLILQHYGTFSIPAAKMKILRYLLVLIFPLCIQSIPILEQINAVVGRNIESMSPMGIGAWAQLQGKPDTLNSPNHNGTGTVDAELSYVGRIAPLGLRSWAKRSIQTRHAENNS